jgi:CheY-like chemotaxis protein
MDCNMPIMDGFNSSLKINELYQDNEETSVKAPIIVCLTAYVSDEVKKKAL